MKPQPDWEMFLIIAAILIVLLMIYGWVFLIESDRPYVTKTDLYSPKYYGIPQAPPRHHRRAE